MASIMRPALLRQIALANAAARTNPLTSASRKALVQPTAAGAAQRDALSSIARVASFHTTSRRNLLPPGPQVIQGSVNEPAPVPAPSPTHGSYHWTFERLLAAGLVPLTVAPFAAGSLNPTLDAVLCSALLLHSHLGFQNIIVDYVPLHRYRAARLASVWGLRLATALVAVGLYEFETNDVGLTEAVKRVWKA